MGLRKEKDEKDWDEGKKRMKKIGIKERKKQKKIGIQEKKG